MDASPESRKRRSEASEIRGKTPQKRGRGAEEEEDDTENVENNATRNENCSTSEKRSQESNVLAEEAIAGEEKKLLSPRRSLNPQGRPPECGVIKKIYVENFMCHTKMSVDLNRNVNFISGRNGSGKSAILAAIQICLGANARRTNRAQNIKDLVRKETAAGALPSCAKIRVTLLNGGTDGYKPDIYGAELTVERTIAVNGGFNGYKLLDEKGKEQSRDKKDLLEMLDVLNIQVDNPVAILDQEEAKKFLTGKSTDKWKFFLKACELERIENQTGETMDQYEELKSANARAVASLSSRMEDVDRKREKFEEFKEQEKLKYKKLELDTKYAWAIFQAKKQEHDDSIQKQQEFQAKANAQQEKLTQAEEAANENGEERNEKKQRIRDLSDEAAVQAELKQRLEAELKEMKVPQQARKRQLKDAIKLKYHAENAVAAAKKKLKEVRDEILRNSGSRESEDAQRAEALQRAEAELEVAESKKDALKQEWSDATRLVEEAESRAQACRQSTRSIQNQLNNAERVLQGLESAGNDSLAVFGPRTAKVWNMVEEAKKQRKFLGPVEGPIGACLKIVPGKEAYAQLAELALGVGVLDRFIVTNDKDRQVLQAIRQKSGCGQDCGIFQVHRSGSRFQVPLPPVDGIETAASVLQITSDLVFNCLVDNCRIEKIGLGQSKDDSQEKLLTTDATGRKVVRGGKITQCYFLPKGDMWQVKSGTISLISNERRMERKIAVDKSEAITAARRECEQYEAELAEAKKEEHRYEAEHNNHAQAYQRADRARRNNENKINDLRDRIDKIKEEMDNAAPDDAIDTSVYEDEVQQCEEELAKLVEQCTRIKAEYEEAQPPIDEKQSNIDDVSIRNEKILKELEQAETEMTQFMETQSQKTNEVEKRRERLQKFQIAMTKHQLKIDDLAAAMAEARNTARLIHYRLLYMKTRLEAAEQDGAQVSADRTDEEDMPEPTEEQLNTFEDVDPGHNADYFESRIKKVESKIEKEKEKSRSRGQSIEEAYKTYIDAKEEMHKMQQQLIRNQEIEQSLETDIRARKARWMQLKQHLKHKTKVKFVEYLEMNKMIGRLVFDEQGESLDLEVQKNDGGRVKKTQTKDVKALSGGERSFTTICLLIALGESLETPFRVLDEFDVFLDTSVRKNTIKLLVTLAKKMEHRQFIFITPQDLSGIKDDPQLKIHRLKPPARHNTAGGASQRTLDFTQQEE